MPFFAVLARGPLEDVDAALAKVQELTQRHTVFLQLVDPGVVYNERHVRSAFQHAVRATHEARGTANTLGAEFLLYLTAQRQVQNALRLAGVKKGADVTLVVADGDRAGTAIWGLLDKLGWSRDPGGVPTNAKALKALGIAAPKVGSPEDAVLERVALLDVQK